MAQPTTATVDQHWLSARDRSVIAILPVSTFVVILNEHRPQRGADLDHGRLGCRRT